MNYRIFFLTTITMMAFAANSVICRLALVNPANSPVSFTLVRLLSGAVVLSFFFFKSPKNEKVDLSLKSFLAPLMLFSYAFFFSLSYVQLAAGTGALILFSCVQLTMMFAAYLRGQKMSRQENMGFILAISGFFYLLLPGASTPPVAAAALMVVAGVSWGVYSLLGQNAVDPIYLTAKNFLFTVPIIILLSFFFPFQLTHEGVLLAVGSGAVTSGLGYVLWYFVLKDLKTNSAALIQLSVPALATFGGVLFLDETIKVRLIVASFLILTGIFLKLKPL